MTHTAIKKVSTNRDFDWDWGAVWRSCLEEARRILRCPHAAEDAAQQALVRAWRRRATCRQPDRPLVWLGQIARNEALRHLARERKRREAVFDDAVFAGPATLDDPLEALVAELDLDRLVASLPPADRQLVRLRYVEDLTHSEIADRLGVPAGTAKVRLHRLRRRLAARLESEV